MQHAGAFDGVLTSTYNPAWDGTTVQRCNEPTFNVTGPSGLVNSRTAHFTWTSNDSARRPPSTAPRRPPAAAPTHMHSCWWQP